ncbi:MAG: GTP cyclohydrolase II [Anaerolineaceae bacterium]
MYNTSLKMTKSVCARVPTESGEFRLCLYTNDQDDKEHLAIISGEVQSKPNVLVRIHSECFTGEVLGSRRCDCGEQLSRSMELIAREGSGVVIYLRQEGRGIGLRSKLLAYNLQDKGMDTVDANLALGHDADERDYQAAECILRDLGITSVRLLTNNPDKVSKLEELGITVSERIPLHTTIYPDNYEYLQTKAAKMNHIIGPDIFTAANFVNHVEGDILKLSGIETWLLNQMQSNGSEPRPLVTLSWAQSMDGSISINNQGPTAISFDGSRKLTHWMRSIHDVILVGIGTVISDNPQLDVRLTDGKNPQPVILDTHLRIPDGTNLLKRSSGFPWIVVGSSIDYRRCLELEKRGAMILEAPEDDSGRIDLTALLLLLRRMGIRSILVEGGAQVLTSFLREKLADIAVITSSPFFLGGYPSLTGNVVTRKNGSGLLAPSLIDAKSESFGPDMVTWGRLGEKVL